MKSINEAGAINKVTQEQPHMNNINVEILGKNIKNPLLKLILAPLIFIIVGAVLFAFIVLSIPLHFILIGLGRRGFVDRVQPFSYRVTKVGFERVPRVHYF